MRVSAIFMLAAAGVARAAYWMEDIAHQGKSAYHPDPNYQVFRNVKDFGAVGDGVHDDTAAINKAISFGGRCAPGVCKGETTSPATVYFPPGTYLITDSILDYFYTQIIGDPTDRPVIKAAASFPTETTLGLLDGNKYGANGLAWGATNVFFRQLRNLVFDTTAIPAGKSAFGVHWPSSQATAITNCVFKLAEGPDSKHIGILIEEGSGGLLNDLEFHGGMFAASFGNQQYTARNLKFYNAQVAINQLWDWGWTYKNIHIENCETGIQMADTNTASITLIDSSFKNVGTAIKTIRNPGVSTPPSAGSLMLKNVQLSNVGKTLVGPQGTILPGSGGTTVNDGFAMGHIYTPNGPTDYTGSDPSYFPSLSVLQSGGEYYAQSKPHYENVPASKFVSARTFGAKGDGVTDDTVALNNLFNYVTAKAAEGLIAFVDAGTYYVSDTVFIPPNAKIVGEALASIIMGGGSKFEDMTKPHPVIKVAIPGQTGSLEWSDMIVSTRGPAAGAKLIEYNLNTAGTPAGMWDVHVRVGGFAGTQQQLAQCPTTPKESNNIDKDCIAAWMSMHITKGASNVFMENCWIWVADHDLEDPTYTQITIYAGRGLLVESTAGKIWLSASGVEHHTLYQYQLYKTQNVYMGQIQTETPYYQPNPPATVPFPRHKGFHDPNFAKDCANADPNGPPCAMAWGLRIISSRNIVIYGAGLYSFFNNYSTDCCQIGAGARCQARIFELKNVGCENVTNVDAYNLNIVGTTSMITRYGKDVALYKDNIAGFTAGLALYKHD